MTKEEAAVKLSELDGQITALRKQQKELYAQLKECLDVMPIDMHWQDKTTGLVYKIVAPTGTFVDYKTKDYHRTKKEDEAKGSLSKTEAQELGYTLK